MDPITKTYVSFGLVVLALFEFWAAMSVRGASKPPPSARLRLRLHRIFGYVFLAYFIWISYICLDLMNRLANAGGYDLDSRATIHATLALAIIAVLLLKISFVRSFPKYRANAPTMGIVITVATLVLWFLAGYMFMWLL
jgi:cation transport ATPase